MENFISGFDTAGFAANMFGGLAGGLMNFGFNSYLQDKQFVLQNQMYDRMHRDAINDWNMVNEYNSPAAVRARKEAAGYNALDEMSINPAQPIQQSNPSAPAAAPASFTNPVYDAIQGALAANQIELQKTQIDVSLLILFSCALLTSIWVF